jgi:hypothetical protein
MDLQLKLGKMEERLDELEVKIDLIDSKLSTVIDALVGNKILKSDGLVSRLEKFEKELQELKEFKNKILYGVAAIVSLGIALDFLLKTYLNLKK